MEESKDLFQLNQRIQKEREHKETLKESPKYLIQRDQQEKGIPNLLSVSRFKKKEQPSKERIRLILPL